MSKRYEIDEDMINPEFELVLSNGVIVYKDVGILDAYKVIDFITKCVHLSHNIQYSEITVVGGSLNFLKNCEAEYRKQTKLPTERMFETNEEYEALTKEQLPSALKDFRRTKKLHFHGASSVIKFSTIQSYKGWESDTIVELVEPANNQEQGDTECELIYTGFTRAKRNLFVINCGNTAYGKELQEIFS